MPPIELIVNGGFESGLTGWTNTDGEVNPESSYFSPGSSNRVSEVDGNTGQTTVLEQSITVGAPVMTQVTFDYGLRTAAAGDAGTDGFRVEILDSGGGTVAFMDYFPTATSMGTAPPLDVNFTSAGTYTLRITELGDDDSLGAVIDNISIMDCFTGDALIKTTSGFCKAIDIVVGQDVWTQNGYQKVKWIGIRAVSKAEQIADTSFRAVRFEQGSLGAGLPNRALLVSQNHRMVLSNWKVQAYVGVDQALAPAKHLIDGENIALAPCDDIEYVHFIFDAHEIVEANGCLTESFFPGEQAMRGVERDALDELLALFPELKDGGMQNWKTALPILKSHETALVLSE
jgi:hypothetical protein